jgi:NADPH2:quinone reductase
MASIPDSMTAITIAGYGGPECLVAQEIPTPRPSGSQVLIRVAAAGVNRPDVIQRRGHYPAPKGHSPIPGLEVAGEIVLRGPGATAFGAGAKVMALVNGGGYAEYCLAEEGACLPVPETLAMTEAAGVPETFFTVWHNVFERGRLKAGEWFLVHGGSSGIGTTAIQLAKALGANVIATAGSAAKCNACLELGADHALNYNETDFVAATKDITGGKGCDLILDMVGGDYVDRNIKAAAEDGRIVNIAFQKGGLVTVDLQRMMLKRLTLTGSTLRVRTNAVKAQIARGLAEHVLPLLADRRVRVIVYRTFPLREAAEAHRLMEQGSHIGKIILTV